METNRLLVKFLRELIERKTHNASRLSTELGVSHATVSRWLSGNDIPSMTSYQKLGRLAGLSLEEVLRATGYLPKAKGKGEDLPEFREYAKQKYASELDDDLISVIEDLIERRRRNAAREERRPHGGSVR